MSTINSISSPRLSSYRTIFNCPTDPEALKFYFWNQAVTSELYVLLHNIEICLRNRIHEVLSLEASNQVSHNYAWYDQFDFTIPNATNRNGQPKLSKTGEAIAKVITDLQTKGKALTPQNVICNIEFGKWYYILKTTKYKNGNPIDWNTSYPLIFKNYSNFSKSGRSALFSRVDEVRLLRNRVAHLEPVWKFSTKKVNGKIVAAPTNYNDVMLRLNEEISWAVNVLNWLCNDSHDHYIHTNSYRRLRILVTDPGIMYFAI